MKITIEIAFAYKKWTSNTSIKKNKIKRILKNILQRFPNLGKVKNYELSILLTDDENMEELNTKFRFKNKTTNVLSFPEIRLNWKRLLEFKPEIEYMYLGDIAFGYQIIKSEAESQNKSFENHFIHLLVHSILHLLGYDHENQNDAKAMKKLEIEILKDFAIPTPY